MRYINDIIIHCTGNRVDTKLSLEDIRKEHRRRGFNDIGYHYVVFPDGRVERGRYISQPGAHCKGHNAHSIGIAYVGGLDGAGRPADTRTAAQRAALQKLIAKLLFMYRCQVHGHRDYNPNKACPCFDARADYGPMAERIKSINR